jgi:cytochrome b6-f complex iron-sulfur subunit
MSVDDINMPLITPQQYEVLHGGGAEAAEIAQRRLSRRRFLRRSMLAVWGVSTVAAVAGALAYSYPTLSGDFGSSLVVGKKADFKPATPDKFQLEIAGVYHRPVARAYIVHMAPETQFLLADGNLQTLLGNEYILKDSDGSYWVALYQKCVHLGCTYAFRDSCISFKCPCHGSHYNVDGEYLDGPAPRSLDRFRLSFDSGNVVVNTGDINSTVQQPEDTTRLIASPTVSCV